MLKDWEASVTPKEGSPEWWDEQPLGRLPDSVLAKLLGVSRKSVNSNRKKRGIPNVTWEMTDARSTTIIRGPISYIKEKPGVTASEVRKLFSNDQGTLQRDLAVASIISVVRNGETLYFHKRHLAEDWQEAVLKGET